MYSPAQIHRARGAAGDPLPVVWHALKEHPFRRGQLALISAGPGTGKSAFTLNYAIKAAVPALYFSADSDSFTQHGRMIAIATGRTLKEAFQVIRDETPIPEIDRLPVQWSFDASPTIEAIEDEVAAYTEVYGMTPDLIVVDNISNVRAEVAEDSATGALDSVMEHLHVMSRRMGSCVVGLHHVTSTYNNGDKCIPLNGVKSQVTDKPELVFTLAKKPADEWNSMDTLMVAPVKNRAGKPDPSGNSAINLAFDGERMQIGDIVHA